MTIYRLAVQLLAFFENWPEQLDPGDNEQFERVLCAFDKAFPDASDDDLAAVLWLLDQEIGKQWLQ